MIESVKFLEENGYLYLKDFVDKKSCQLMTMNIFDLINRKKGVRDSDCPLSFSFNGAFDQAQYELLPILEGLCGKKLLATMNYTRFYMPNEVLEKHIDCEICEYSITVTLDFNGSPWPFYIEDAFLNERQIIMTAGDAVLYKGHERPHWRKKYVEGKWQAQTFFHYVDSDGKFTNYPEIEKMKLRNAKNDI